MSLLSQASLIVTPNAYKEGKLYSVIPSDGSGDMSVVRATSATRVNSEGLIEVVSLLGNELVTNGDFSDGSANWGNYINGSSTIVFTDVATLNIDASNSNVGIYQENVFTSGKQYKIVLKMKASSSFDAEILETQQASTISTIGSVSLTTSYQNFTFYFTATGNNDIFIHRKFSAASANQSITIDNVSVKEVITNNIPRIDYSLGGCPSILLEPQRTNLFTYSEDFGAWAANPGGISSIEPNYAISPEGVENAYKVNFVVQGDSDLALVRGHSVIGGATYAYSIYIKGEGSDIGKDIVVKSKRSGGDSAGTITTQTLTGEWVRVDFTTTYAANNTAANFYISSNDATSCLIYGAQAELGSYATSYIPTYGTSVTRNQDVASKTGISSLINSEEGVLYAEIKGFISFDTIEPNRYITLTNGTSNERVALLLGGNLNQLRAIIYSSTQSMNLSFTTSLTDVKQYNKLAVKYKSGDYAFFVNGVKIGGSIITNAFSANTLTKLSFDVGDGTQQFRGYAKGVIVYKTALTDEQCSILTSDSYPTAAAAYASLGLVSESPSCLTSTTTF